MLLRSKSIMPIAAVFLNKIFAGLSKIDLFVVC